MITALGELVRNVAVLVLLTMFLQMLLPEGQMSGFIRMIMGILLISAVLSPLLDFFGQDQIAPVYNKSSYEASTTEIIGQGQALAAEYTAHASEDYKEGLSRQITAIAGLLPQLSQVEVAVDLNQNGSIEQVYIEGVLDNSLSSHEATQSKLVDVIGDFFNLAPEILIIKLNDPPE